MRMAGGQHLWLDKPGTCGADITLLSATCSLCDVRQPAAVDQSHRMPECRAIAAQSGQALLDAFPCLPSKNLHMRERRIEVGHGIVSDVSPHNISRGATDRPRLRAILEHKLGSDVVGLSLFPRTCLIVPLPGFVPGFLLPLT